MEERALIHVVSNILAVVRIAVFSIDRTWLTRSSDSSESGSTVQFSSKPQYSRGQTQSRVEARRRTAKAARLLQPLKPALLFHQRQRPLYRLGSYMCTDVSLEL